jgi:hypothetical protein
MGSRKLVSDRVTTLSTSIPLGGVACRMKNPCLRVGVLSCSPTPGTMMLGCDSPPSQRHHPTKGEAPSRRTAGALLFLEQRAILGANYAN